jgi:hypothetical protein
MVRTTIESYYNETQSHNTRLNLSIDLAYIQLECKMRISLL